MGFWGSRAALKESLRNLLLHGSWIRHGAAKIRRRSKQEKKTIKKKSDHKPEEEHNRQPRSKQKWNLNISVLLEDLVSRASESVEEAQEEQGRGKPIHRSTNLTITLSIYIPPLFSISIFYPFASDSPTFATISALAILFSLHRGFGC